MILPNFPKIFVICRVRTMIKYAKAGDYGKVERVLENTILSMDNNKDIVDEDVKDQLMYNLDMAQLLMYANVHCGVLAELENARFVLKHNMDVKAFLRERMVIKRLKNQQQCKECKEDIGALEDLVYDARTVIADKIVQASV
jgi:hypothetical protein